LHRIQERPAVEQAGAVPEIARIPGAEERSVTLDGVTWKYWRAGTGPPLLLIHGFMGYSFSWRFNVQSLSHHFSVYAMDLPGCGFSQRTEDPGTTLAGDAEGVLRFMDHLGIEEADLVGSSRGGGLIIVLGALLARRNMLHRIRRLVLVSPINPWSSNGRRMTRILATTIGGVCVMRVIPKMHLVLKRYFKALYGDPKRISPGSIEGYKAAFDVPGSFEHLLRIVRSWHDDLALVDQSLPAIANLPTLLLWGTRDTAVFPSSIHQLERVLKNSALVLLRGVGHLPYEEVPEEFNRIVDGFLLHHTPPTPKDLSARSAFPVSPKPHRTRAEL
jgi:pimeloyl-ACP methyl ester carboxylesterase